MNDQPSSNQFDVIIVGGALAGASSAILLLRERPDLRVLIVERSTAFTRRVGEATVEISSYFLSRVLGLTQYLNETQLVKQGMRFWFKNAETRTLADCSEIGGRYLARVPAYQLDRATVDAEVLRRALMAGATIWRPAAVQKVDLVSGGRQTVTVQVGNRVEIATGRWVVDASGVAALLSRQNGWFVRNDAHPTTAVWSRWTGVKDWDGFELAQKFPDWAKACHGIRATATNHLMGDGWWAWFIPLKGGDTSVGVVYDQRTVQWPESGSVGERLKQFLCEHPVGREILGEAEWIEGDVHVRKNLPYSSTTYAGDGFALVGDAGAFLDPFYSPGMDWLSFTVVKSTDLILAQLRGEAVGSLIEVHNREFVRSYQRWFTALYLDKYDYMGEFDLMRLGFLLDLGFYYIGVAVQPYKRGLAGLREPVFTTSPSTPFYHLMRIYNRRFAAMGRDRRRRLTLGSTNRGTRFLFGGYTFEASSARPIARALVGWLVLEITEGWRTWWRSSQRDDLPLKAAPRPASV